MTYNAKTTKEKQRRLKDRFNEHRRAVDKTNIKSKPTTVSEHFLSDSNHSHTDMQFNATRENSLFTWLSS